MSGYPWGEGREPTWVLKARAPETLDGYVETLGRGKWRVESLRVWCWWCDAWHRHGVGSTGVKIDDVVDRAAHCLAREDSPYAIGGYRVAVKGAWPDDVPHGTAARYSREIRCRCTGCRSARVEWMVTRGARGRRPVVPESEETT